MHVRSAGGQEWGCLFHDDGYFVARAVRGVLDRLNKDILRLLFIAKGLLGSSHYSHYGARAMLSLCARPVEQREILSCDAMRCQPWAAPPSCAAIPPA